MTIIDLQIAFCGRIQTNVPKLTERHFMIQQDNYPESMAKATKDIFRVKRWNILDWVSQSPDLSLSCIPLAGDQTEARERRQQVRTEGVCSKGLSEHHQGRYRKICWWVQHHKHYLYYHR